MRHYEYRHTVTFQETNLLGNVYYTHHLAWQGRCRELFLHDHAPQLLHEFEHGLSLATVRCACEYLAELAAFDLVLVRMHLVELVQNRLTLGFDYVRLRDGHEELVAHGEQQIACMRREANRLVAAPVPQALRDALAPYGA